MGEPGSGKGTQGKALGELPGFFHLSCGDVFRRLNHRSSLGKTFLKYSSQGLLVPDDFTVHMWADHIHKLEHTNHFHPEDEIVILDGIPRNRHQAEMMEEHIIVSLLITLEATDENKLIERIHRRALHENRLDDTHEDVVRRRFQEYKEVTEPILAYYSDHLIRRIDATGSPIDVLFDIIKVIRDEIAIPLPQKT
jgi:adenylate kinase